MEKDEKLKIIERYNKRLAENGDTPKALGWDKERHNLRFFILTSLWELNEASVLDFGCGLGDLWGYLDAQNKRPARYLGVDINSQLIGRAQKKYPSGEFRTFDFDVDILDSKFDFVFSSGAHNFKLKNNWDYIEKSILSFDKWSSKGFAINFLSDKVDFRANELHYTNPSQVLDFCYGISRNVVLRNDYMPFEFTVFVRKDDPVDPEKTVFNRFLKYL
ncbi:MAG: class I SAM-dependent methyltransferase [Bdellovibrionales bacterium]